MEFVLEGGINASNIKIFIYGLCTDEFEHIMNSAAYYVTPLSLVHISQYFCSSELMFICLKWSLTFPLNTPVVVIVVGL